MVLAGNISPTTLQIITKTTKDFHLKMINQIHTLKFLESKMCLGTSRLRWKANKVICKRRVSQCQILCWSSRWVHQITNIIGATRKTRSTSSQKRTSSSEIRKSYAKCRKRGIRSCKRSKIRGLKCCGDEKNSNKTYWERLRSTKSRRLCARKKRRKKKKSSNQLNLQIKKVREIQNLAHHSNRKF